MSSHVLDAIFEQAWAITPQALETIARLAQREDLNVDPKVFHASGLNEPEALMVIRGEPLEGARRTVLRERSAIIPIVGPIFPRSNLMTLSGATSVDIIGRDLQVALDSDEVDTIVLNIDSPGGAITGTSELSDRIYAARAIKPVYAYVFGTAASGAYWLGSAASEVIAADTARLGSIGVVALFTDRREKDERTGVKEIEIVSSVSPKKRPDPSTDEGRSQIQQMVDDLASVFVGAVARNRGVDESVVLEQFGQGDTIIASKAIGAGMADTVGSLESLIAEANDQAESTPFFVGGSRMDPKSKSDPAVTQTVSVEQVKTSSPDTYNAIMEIGRKEGVTAGAESERTRIAAILALKAPGFEAFIVESAMKPEASAGSVSQDILAKQSETREQQAASHGADASALGSQAASLEHNSEHGADNDDNAEINAAAAKAAAAANASRGYRDK